MKQGTLLKKLGKLSQVGALSLGLTAATIAGADENKIKSIQLQGTAADGIQKKEHEVYHGNFAKASLEKALKKQNLKLADYGNYTLKLSSKGNNVLLALSPEKAGNKSPTLKDVPYEFRVKKGKTPTGQEYTITENMETLLKGLNYNAKLMEFIVKKTSFAGEDKFVDKDEFAAYELEMNLLGRELQANLNRYSKAKKLRKKLLYAIKDRDKDGMKTLADMKIDETNFRDQLSRLNAPYVEVRNLWRVNTERLVAVNLEVLKKTDNKLYEAAQNNFKEPAKVSNLNLSRLDLSLRRFLGKDYITPQKLAAAKQRRTATQNPARRALENTLINWSGNDNAKYITISETVDNGLQLGGAEIFNDMKKAGKLKMKGDWKAYAVMNVPEQGIVYRFFPDQGQAENVVVYSDQKTIAKFMGKVQWISDVVFKQILVPIIDQKYGNKDGKIDEKEMRQFISEADKLDDPYNGKLSKDDLVKFAKLHGKTLDLNPAAQPGLISRGKRSPTTTHVPSPVKTTGPQTRTYTKEQAEKLFPTRTERAYDDNGKQGFKGLEFVKENGKWKGFALYADGKQPVSVPKSWKDDVFKRVEEGMKKAEAQAKSYGDQLKGYFKRRAEGKAKVKPIYMSQDEWQAVYERSDDYWRRALLDPMDQARSALRQTLADRKWFEGKKVKDHKSKEERQLRWRDLIGRRFKRHYKKQLEDKGYNLNERFNGKYVFMVGPKGEAGERSEDGERILIGKISYNPPKGAEQYLLNKLKEHRGQKK